MTKTFKQIREIDVPKGHEYGPSSRKRPAGKAGYTSSDSARTTHLKTVKKWSKKKRRQGDKEFANEAPEHPRNIRFWDSRAKQVAIDTIKNPSKSLLGGPTAAEAEKVLKVKFGYTDAQIKKLKEEVPANATGTAVAGTGDDSSTVVVKKKKEQQSKLMKRITDSIDKAIPTIKKEEDEITTRKKQLKELAKNRNV